ncbi:MAG: hypothetical protein KDA28_08775, partial [Phycisphaerales bacterium]|nr:hypothetical protein [Phycisphaerales bacterium]
FMWRTGDTIQHASGPGYEAVDLPYGGGAFSMTVLLPDPGVSLEAVVEGLGPETWSGLVDSFAPTRLDLALPRFEMAYARQLNEDLRQLGMTAAFDPEQADFSRLSSKMRLYLSDVRHKAWVRVDEEGTRAAAATSVGASFTSAPPTFLVDRPFLFALREHLSGTILFLGKVVDTGASD